MSGNNSSSSSTSCSGMFTALLTVAFIVLKLTHVIDWSWVWVLSPIWISLSLGLFVIAIIFGIYFLSEMRKP